MRDMWMAQRGRATQREETIPAQVGSVTQSQLPMGVYVDGERRNLPLFSPGGYSWRPGVGDQVLVVKSDGGDCVVGKKQEPQILDAGEVKIASGDDAEIHLTADGKIALTGEVSVNGELLEEMIARIIVMIMAGMGG